MSFTVNFFRLVAHLFDSNSTILSLGFGWSLVILRQRNHSYIRQSQCQYFYICFKEIVLPQGGTIAEADSNFRSTRFRRSHTTEMGYEGFVHQFTPIE